TKKQIMQESVIYQDILQKGLQQGEERGKKQEALQLILRQLRDFQEINYPILWGGHLAIGVKLRHQPKCQVTKQLFVGDVDGRL
ncbi:MAG: hypothetical protein ACYT04_58220, partial [Nostoc sp.]